MNTLTTTSLLSVPYTTAPQAAESQAAYMSNTDAFDAVVTGDYDSLIFGASRTIRKFTTSANTIEIMSLDETLESNNITYEQLVLATILCGSDYNDGVSGVGPKTSISLVQEKPTIDELRSELDFWINYMLSMILLIFAVVVIGMSIIIVSGILKYLYIKISWWFKDIIYKYQNK